MEEAKSNEVCGCPCCANKSKAVDYIVLLEGIQKDIEILLKKHGLDQIIIFDQDNAFVKSVSDIAVNGSCLQLNTERWEEGN